LNEKEKDIIRLTREKVYTDLTILQMQQRIDSLEEETTQLRKALNFSQQAME
jgi:cell shape-determining protein MreC